MFCEWLWRCGSDASCPRWKRSIVTDRQLGRASTAYRLNPTTPARLQPPLIGFPVAQVLVLLRFNESRLIGTDATPKWVNTWAHPSTFSPLCSTLKYLRPTGRNRPPVIAETESNRTSDQLSPRFFTSARLSLRRHYCTAARSKMLYSQELIHSEMRLPSSLSRQSLHDIILDPRRCCFIKLI